MKTIRDFSRICEIPDFIVPWIDRFYEKIEIELIFLLTNNSMTAKEIKRKFSSKCKSEAFQDQADVILRAYRRGVLHRCDNGRFEPATFHERFDKWAMFEGWKDIPDDIRARLVDWELADYDHHHQDQLNGLKTGLPRDRTRIYPEYILLHEAEALLERAKTTYLMPCNCRSMVRGCSQPMVTCIRFDDDRGLGWEISTSRAKEIVCLANKKGLMQSGEVRVDENGELRGAVCNCCPDCCFPHRLAQASNAQKLWPLSRYVALHLQENCIACGLCVKRCPFQAFTIEKKNGAATSRWKTIVFDSVLCRGCGVCCTACPKKAIEMAPVVIRPSSIDDVLGRKVNKNCPAHLDNKDTPLSGFLGRRSIRTS